MKITNGWVALGGLFGVFIVFALSVPAAMLVAFCWRLAVVPFFDVPVLTWPQVWGFLVLIGVATSAIRAVFK